MNFSHQTGFLPLPMPNASRDDFRAWLMQYLGKPGGPGEEGPDTFDCYGLCRQIHWFTTGELLPEFPGVDRGDQEQVARTMAMQVKGGPWEGLGTPAHGCIVGVSSHRKIHHCGLFLAVDGGMVLHVPNYTKVICEKMILFFKYNASCINSP